MKNPTFLKSQVKANWAYPDCTNLKVNRTADITESKMSEIEDIEDILILEFIKAVENWKKMVKNRNKDYLTMTDLEFSKILTDFEL